MPDHFASFRRTWIILILILDTLLDVGLMLNCLRMWFFSPHQKTMIDVAIRDGLRAGLHYKQIYALAKDKVSLLVPLLPKS